MNNTINRFGIRWLAILTYHFVHSPFTTMAVGEEKEEREAVVMYKLISNRSLANSSIVYSQRHWVDNLRYCTCMSVHPKSNRNKERRLSDNLE